MNKQASKSTTSDNRSKILSEEDYLLEAEGVCRDPSYLPLFTLYEMFEAIIKHKNITASEIKSKLKAFYHFLSINQIPSFPNSSMSVLVANRNTISDALESDKVFYSNYVTGMFSYIFGIRLQLFFIGKNNQVSCQYFGLKKKPIKRIFMMDNVYYVLKKYLPKTNTFSTRMCSDIDEDEEGSNNSYNLNNQNINKISTSNSGIITHNNPFFYRANRIGIKNEKVIDSYITNSECKIEELDYPLSRINDFNKNCEEKDLNHDTNIINSKKEDNLIPNSLTIETLLSSWTNDIMKDYQLETAQPSKKPQEKADISLGITHYQVEGKLKFYSEVKEYGFILMEENSEVFVHKADLVKQNIDTRYLAYYNKFYNIFMKFDVEEYQGKAKVHRKAINMTILNMILGEK